MNRFIFVVLLAAVVLLAVTAWKPFPPGFLSPIPPLPLAEATPTATPEPTPEPTPTLEPELEPTPEPAPSPACLDGSPLTVTGRDSNQTSYKCESGAVGAYLERRPE